MAPAYSIIVRGHETAQRSRVQPNFSRNRLQPEPVSSWNPSSPNAFLTKSSVSGEGGQGTCQALTFVHVDEVLLGLDAALGPRARGDRVGPVPEAPCDAHHPVALRIRRHPLLLHLLHTGGKPQMSRFDDRHGYVTRRLNHPQEGP